MRKPRNGTCGACRWCWAGPNPTGAQVLACHRHRPAYISAANCGAFPSIEIPTVATCGEFEPPEGRVCGTCSWFGGTYCEIQVPEKRARIQYDTCPAWRWNGATHV